MRFVHSGFQSPTIILTVARSSSGSTGFKRNASAPTSKAFDSDRRGSTAALIIMIGMEANAGMAFNR